MRYGTKAKHLAYSSPFQSATSLTHFSSNFSLFSPSRDTMVESGKPRFFFFFYSCCFHAFELLSTCSLFSFSLRKTFASRTINISSATGPHELQSTRITPRTSLRLSLHSPAFPLFLLLSTPLSDPYHRH